MAYFTEELTTTQSQKLYQAIIADGLEGKLTKYNTHYSTDYEASTDVVDTGNVYTIHMETYSSENSKYDSNYGNDDDYNYYNYINVSFGKDCVNIINAINELGLENLDSAEDIYWGEEEVKFY